MQKALSIYLKLKNWMLEFLFETRDVYGIPQHSKPASRPINLIKKVNKLVLTWLSNLGVEVSQVIVDQLNLVLTLNDDT